MIRERRKVKMMTVHVTVTASIEVEASTEKEAKRIAQGTELKDLEEFGRTSEVFEKYEKRVAV